MSCTMKIIRPIDVHGYRRAIVWFFGVKGGWNVLDTSVNLTRRIKKKKYKSNSGFLILKHYL